MNKKSWIPCEWDGTNDPAITSQFVCYEYPYPGGRIIARVYHDYTPKPRHNAEGTYTPCHYEFTSDQGANSENSYSGCLPPEDNDLTLEDALAKILREVEARR